MIVTAHYSAEGPVRQDKLDRCYLNVSTSRFCSASPDTTYLHTYYPSTRILARIGENTTGYDVRQLYLRICSHQTLCVHTGATECLHTVVWADRNRGAENDGNNGLTCVPSASILNNCQELRRDLVTARLAQALRVRFKIRVTAAVFLS